MILFLNDATKNKKLDNFPNGWTGKELIELSTDLKDHGITFRVDGYADHPQHVLFCSGDMCSHQKFDDLSRLPYEHAELYFI